MYKYLLLILCCLPTFVLFSQDDTGKIKGITMVAPPEEFPHNPMGPISDINATWVAIVPYGYTPPGKAVVKFNIDWQWWGERKEGVIQSIRKAHEQGLKVMLKPQVYIPGSWVGEMDFNSEEEWLKWEKDYRDFIQFFFDLAVAEKVEMFCIGTEYKIAIQKRTNFWLDLIENARCDYEGKICYSSNWDSYQKVPFWEQLDFIGISAYFPLSENKTPSISHLKKCWNPIRTELSAYAQKLNKQILFTEYGYLTVDGCADKSWLIEKKIKHLPINQEAQANAYHALYESFWDEDFWAGGFLWKWFPNGQGHEGYPDKDYTPQNKLSEKTVSFWYGKP